MKKCIWMVCFGVVFSSSALAAEEKNKAVQPAKPSLTVVLVKPQQASMVESVLANGSLAAWQELLQRQLFSVDQRRGDGERDL